jgi:hypothetical protein
MMSALLYLRLLQRQIEFTQGPRAINKLITTAEASEWNYTTPNVTLRTEWDIESVILTFHKELNVQFDFVHIKSHQDDTTPHISGQTVPRIMPQCGGRLTRDQIHVR